MDGDIPRVGADTQSEALTGTSLTTTGVNSDRLGAILIQMNVLDEAGLAAAIADAAATSRPLGQALLNQGRISRGDLYEALAQQGHPLSAVKLDQLPAWDTLFEEKGGAGAQDKGVLMIAHAADKRRRCFVVMAEGALQADIRGPVARAAKDGYNVAGTVVVPINLIAVMRDQWNSRSSLEKSTEDQSQLQADFDEIAYRAFKLGASDIHISVARVGQIHLRLHGELEHVRDLSLEYATDLVSTVYNTMVETNSTKEGFNPRIPQDAVIERAFPEGLVRFRYSCLPIAPAGFDVTLRIIPIGIATKRKEMSDLGYSPDQCEVLERIFSHSSGMILFCGTTGSGKSTSMANQLEKVALERPGKKIRTIEEPVEYRIPGTYQTPVTRIHGDGRDFSIVLRQIMRADPDILMVGEIRDADTAELAIQAVRSGHLCVSTLHANGAPVCYDRLVGLGINRHDMASVGLFVGLIYQALVQVLCPRCKVSAEDYKARNPDARIFNRLEAVTETLDGIYFRSQSGCAECHGRGVTGRTVCAEILLPTPSMLAAVAAGDSPGLWQLWRETIDQDHPEVMTGRTAFEHALYKMRSGLVSPLSVEGTFHFLDTPPFEDLR